MRRYRTLPRFVVAAAFLVAWHGVLLAAPHTHGDRAVPRLAAVCLVAHPGSGQFHVHPLPPEVPPGGCLACLVAGTVSLHATAPQAASSGAGALPGAGRPALAAAAAPLGGPHLRAPPAGA